MKTAICLLMLALALTATPAAAQSIPAVKDAEWCRAFDPQQQGPSVYQAGFLGSCRR